MAKAAELDDGLVTGLKAAKSKRAYFALVLKGSSDGALIISKTKVPPAAITGAKKQSGGSAVLKGFCRYEEGTYVFETGKQAPSTAAQAVKIIAKRDAGLAVKAEFRVSTDAELLADEGDSTGATPPPAPPVPAPPKAATSPPSADGAALTKRLGALTADIKSALAGPNKARVQALYVAVSGQIKNKDFVQASKILDELEPLLKPAATASAADSTAEWKAKLANWTPAIKAALAAKGANAAAVAKLLGEASGLAKPGGNMAAAIAKLTECHALAAASGEAAAAGNGAAGGNGADAGEARWTARRQAIEKLYLEALKKQPASAGQLRAVLAFADGKAETQDFVKALQGLDSLDKLLQAATATNGPPPVASTGKVAAAVLRAELEQIRLRAGQGIGQLAAALRGVSDPRGAQVADIITQLSSNLPAQTEPLLAQLDSAVKAGDAALVKSLRGEIQKSAKSWLAFLQDNADYIRGCETNPLGISIAIAEPIRGALKSIVKITA